MLQKNNYLIYLYDVKSFAPQRNDYPVGRNLAECGAWHVYCCKKLHPINSYNFGKIRPMIRLRSTVPNMKRPLVDL